jgi:hypothetical protein
MTDPRWTFLPITEVRLRATVLFLMEAIRNDRKQVCGGCKPAESGTEKCALSVECPVCQTQRYIFPDRPVETVQDSRDFLIEVRATPGALTCPTCKSKEAQN